jgi:hypothetical protein
MLAGMTLAEILDAARPLRVAGCTGGRTPFVATRPFHPPTRPAQM